MPITSKMLSKYPNCCFIETGTWLGDGVKAAIDSGFTKIHTIEINLNNITQAQKNITIPNNITVNWICGDSGTKLLEILDNIECQCTIFLDSHSIGDSSGYNLPNPLYKELEAIKNHCIKTHTILIDDRRLFGQIDFNNISEHQIINKLLDINPQYTILFEDGCVKDDIIVAKP